jgi:hypothetical protein
MDESPDESSRGRENERVPCVAILLLTVAELIHPPVAGWRAKPPLRGISS